MARSGDRKALRGRVTKVRGVGAHVDGTCASKACRCSDTVSSPAKEKSGCQ